MNKNLLLSLLVFCTLTAGAQSAGEWLSLTPVKVHLPALSNVKDVNNKLFSADMLQEYASININDLTPENGKTDRYFNQLKWNKAEMMGDTVIVSGDNTTLNYYAVYIQNRQWVKGNLLFKLFGNAEIYIDGQKKLTYSGQQTADKSIFCEFIPGKHTVIVKTVAQGGKAFAASFKADTDVPAEDILFTTAPQHGTGIYDILDGKRVSSAEVSPSGEYAIVSFKESIDGKSNYTTYVYRISDKQIIYSFPGGSVYPQWTPGHDRLSYMSKEGNGNSLYVYDIQKQQISCLLKEDTQIKNYTWAPDLSYLIYYVSENYADKDWELRKLAGIEDRQGYYRQRSWLCKYDFATGLHSRLTWGNLSTSLMDISRDGKQILFSTSRPDYNEFPYSKQSIYLLDINSMKVDTLWKNRIFGISCSFSPDGKQLLISGGPSAFGKIGENIGNNPIVNQYDSQLYIYDLTTKSVKPITRDFNPAVSNAIWHTDGKIYLTAADADYVHLFRYDALSGKIEQMECPGDVITSTSFPEKGDRILYIASKVSYPTEIYTLRLNSGQAELWDNPVQEQYENIVFGEVKDWSYNYKKGTVIDGRYYLPADFDPGKKYPLIVHYYGGTTPTDRSFGGRYPCNLYAANGYVVYILQPSGTTGYGQEFSARHQNNWGVITGDEIISATKAFIKEHPFIDASKVGCIGASYGGFTTMYLTMHTDIFACAISHAGISSLDGYWGDGYWGYTYSTNATAYAFPWNRKDIYVNQSPLFSADKAHNPILLIHGTKDTNVPTAQSMQLYTALKLLGKDAELVFVKDADHHVLDYKQRILWNNTIMAYFAKYLKNQPAWWENIYKDKNL